MEQWPALPPDMTEMVPVGSPAAAGELFGVDVGVWLMNGPDETEVDIVAMPAGGFAFVERIGAISRPGLADSWEELGRSLG